MTVTPYRSESLTSFVGRAAAMRAMDTETFLRKLFPTEDYARPIDIPIDLDAIEYDDFLIQLDRTLDPKKRRLKLMTLRGSEPGIHTKWLIRAGGNSMMGDQFNPEPTHAWCQRCLFEDMASGRDEFLRLSWRMITQTFCLKHRRPLATHCLACHDRQAAPRFLHAEGNVYLICSRCGSRFATQLGLPDMSASTALELGQDDRVIAAWKGAIQFEMALERSLSQKSKQKNKRAFEGFSLALSNMLMASGPQGDGHAVIDLFDSAAFPAQPNPRNIRGMERPYRASSIAVRRKTHGLIAALLKNRANLFFIKGLRQQPQGRAPTFQELRAVLEPEMNATLDRLLLRFPGNWY